MKSILAVFCFLNFTIGFAQSEEEAVKNTVKTFLESFHAQDSLGMTKTVHSDVVLQTIGKKKEGQQQIRTENFGDLIRSITSIPDSIQFQEKIIDYSIQIDGAIANAWTPYEFWLNGKFHHCGVNSFQLFKEEGTWKIIYLIDTRRKDGCN